MWGKYERGIATVSSEVLYLFAQLGADVQYILTGVRSSLALSPDERFLLERWRGSSQERKDAALGALIGAAGNAEFVVKGDVGQQVKVAGNFSQDNVSFLGAASAKDKSK